MTGLLCLWVALVNESDGPNWALACTCLVIGSVIFSAMEYAKKWLNPQYQGLQ